MEPHVFRLVQRFLLRLSRAVDRNVDVLDPDFKRKVGMVAVLKGYASLRGTH